MTAIATGSPNAPNRTDSSDRAARGAGLATTRVPGDNAGNVALGVSLTWRADGTAQSYDLYFGDTAVPPLAVQGLQSTSAQVGGLNPRTTYYWRVVAHTPSGETTTTTWRFTTGNW
jgi:hypothetical protein